MQTIHDERVDLRTWVGVLGTMLGAFMATLDIQVTNASLRDITGGIAATQDEGSWVSTSYLIGEIITIPLTAWLARVFSVRVGSLVFAASCWLNTWMSPDYAGDQFVFSNVIRALGQPFTIVPLSALATSLLQPKDAGDGSAVFNIARNLGGSLGTALLDTIVTRREQFHDFQIGAFINNYRPLVTDRVQTLTTVFGNKGYDSVTATQKAYAQIKNVVRENAYIMAFNDAFLVVAGSLLAGAVLVWLCHQAKAVPGAVTH